MAHSGVNILGVSQAFLAMEKTFPMEISDAFLMGKHKQNWLLVLVLHKLLSPRRAQGQGSSQEGSARAHQPKTLHNCHLTVTVGQKGQKQWYSSSHPGNAVYAAGGDVGTIRM